MQNAQIANNRMSLLGESFVPSLNINVPLDQTSPLEKVAFKLRPESKRRS